MKGYLQDSFQVQDDITTQFVQNLKRNKTGKPNKNIKTIDFKQPKLNGQLLSYRNNSQQSTTFSPNTEKTNTKQTNQKQLSSLSKQSFDQLLKRSIDQFSRNPQIKMFKVQQMNNEGHQQCDETSNNAHMVQDREASIISEYNFNKKKLAQYEKYKKSHLMIHLQKEGRIMKERDLALIAFENDKGTNQGVITNVGDVREYMKATKRRVNSFDASNFTKKCIANSKFSQQNSEFQHNAKLRTIHNMYKMIQQEETLQIKLQDQNEVANSIEELENKIHTLLQYNCSLQIKEESNIQQTKQMEYEIGQQKRKLQMLEKENKTMRDRLEQILNQDQKLHSFIPLFEQFSAMFKGENILKIHDQYKRLEELSVELSSQLNHKEDQILSLERLLLQQKNRFEAESIDSNSKIELLHSQMNAINKLNCVSEDKLQPKVDYQIEYFKLFNAVIELHNRWKTQIVAYDNINSDASSLSISSIATDSINDDPSLTIAWQNLKDPFEVLDMIFRMTKISTTAKCQDFLRKTIVSVNMLSRKYFPSIINQQFDPHLVYDKITKLIDFLICQVKKHKNINVNNLEQEIELSKQIGIFGNGHINLKTFKKSDCGQTLTQNYMKDCQLKNSCIRNSGIIDSPQKINIK